MLWCQVFSCTADTQPVIKSLLHLSSSQYVFLQKLNCLFFVEHLLDGQISWLSLHLLSESVEIPFVLLDRTLHELSGAGIWIRAIA